MPDVEVKGESAHYLLLVQGSHDVGSEACMVRMLHSGSQINGAAAMATISGLLRETSQSSSGILSCYVRRGLCLFLCATVDCVTLIAKTLDSIHHPSPSCLK